MTAQVKIFGPTFSTFVRSVMMACEEKHISYEVSNHIDGQEVAFKSDQHRELHPYSKFPVLLTEHGPIAETITILHYLDRLDGEAMLFPGDSYEQAFVEQWSSIVAIYIDQAIVRNLLLEFAFPKGEGGTVRQDKVEEAMPEVRRALAVLSEQLQGKAYLCGDQFTAADLILIPILDYLVKIPLPIMAEFPSLLEYQENMNDRDTVRSVLG